MKRTALAVIASLFILAGASQAQNANVKFEQGRAKDILRVVSSDIQKYFYDEKLKGLDWQALVKDTEARIQNATTVGGVYTAIFTLVDKIDDSHTNFIPPGRAAFPQFGFKAKPFGDKIFIFDVVENSPAGRAGLKVGDQILSVNNFSASRRSFGKMMVYLKVLQPVARMDLKLMRVGSPQPVIVTVMAKVVQEALAWDSENEFNVWDMVREKEFEPEHSSYMQPKDDGIGYFHLVSFNLEPEVPVRWASAIEKPKAYILDLRGNAGGAVDTVAAVAGFFVSEPDNMAEIVYRKKTEPLKVKPKRGGFVKGPMVVLVDSETMSGGEALARYLQIKKRATIIGDQTPGNLSVARFYTEHIGTDSIVPFGVQVTVGRFVFPGGEEVEKIGVKPDQPCVPSAQQLSDDHDFCYSMAVAHLREQLGYKPKETDKKGQ